MRTGKVLIGVIVSGVLGGLISLSSRMKPKCIPLNDKSHTSSKKTIHKIEGDNLELIIRMRDVGMTFDSISKKMGVSQPTISNKLRSIGYQMPKRKKVSIKRISALRSDGESYPSIAKKLGVSSTTIRSRWKEYNEIIKGDRS